MDGVKTDITGRRRLRIVRRFKIGEIHRQKDDGLSKKLLELEKRLAKSGRRLTDGSGKIKAIGFVGVRKP